MQRRKSILQQIYPDRKIVFLNADPLGESGGGIHCATQQQPKIAATKNALVEGGTMKRLWYWLGQNHQSIQAMAAIFAGVLALGTIVGVKWQIDAAARLQKEQSARDIYREYLNVSMSKPEFAQPDYCAITTSAQFGAYEAYISYMLYTTEQVFALGDGWDEVMQRGNGTARRISMFTRL